MIGGCLRVLNGRREVKAGYGWGRGGKDELTSKWVEIEWLLRCASVFKLCWLSLGGGNSDD